MGFIKDLIDCFLDDDYSQYGNYHSGRTSDSDGKHGGRHNPTHPDRHDHPMVFDDLFDD